jgi:hypothetical protein
MTNELPFQITLLLSILAFLAIRLYYRRKTDTLHVDFTPSQDRTRMRVFLPIIGIPMLGMLIWLMNPAWSICCKRRLGKYSAVRPKEVCYCQMDLRALGLSCGRSWSGCSSTFC